MSCLLIGCEDNLAEELTGQGAKVLLGVPKKRIKIAVRQSPPQLYKSKYTNSKYVYLWSVLCGCNVF